MKVVAVDLAVLVHPNHQYPIEHSDRDTCKDGEVL